MSIAQTLLGSLKYKRPSHGNFSNGCREIS